MSKKRGRPTKNDLPMKVRMGFRISDEMLKDVERVCEEYEIRKTDFILLAIENQLKNQKLFESGEPSAF